MESLRSRRILLASHDTRGARAAEAKALELASGGGAVDLLVVVPDFWKGMCGDDWLNNAVTRERFGRHVEDQLEREIRAHAERLAAEGKAKGVPVVVRLQQGDPAECLVETAAEGSYDLVVVGAPRPRGQPGFRSRMRLETLARGLRVPLLVVPWPAS